jgi:hypothetical protein
MIKDEASRGVPYTRTIVIDDIALELWHVKSEVRKVDVSLDTGLVDELTHQWVTKDGVLSLVLTSNKTEGWPLGLLENDVLFTSPSGNSRRLGYTYIHVTRGVTRQTESQNV